MSSKPPAELLDLESALVTTAGDLAALRRQRAPGRNWLEQVEALAFPNLFETRPQRWPIAAGWEPFRLE